MPKDTPAPETPPGPPMAEVLLARPHTHAGQFHPAGSRISVPADLVPWLIEHGAVESEEG